MSGQVPPASPPALDDGSVLVAVVSSFDDASGLGLLRTADDRRYPFHCTAIADGTRSIAVGTAVACTLVTAHGGRVEATSLVTLPAGNG